MRYGRIEKPGEEPECETNQKLSLDPEQLGQIGENWWEMANGGRMMGIRFFLFG